MHVLPRLGALLLALAGAARAQSLSFSATPNSGGSPLSVTFTWSGSNHTGWERVRISGEGFSASEALALSGNRTVMLPNNGASARTANYTATLYHLLNATVLATATTSVTVGPDTSSTISASPAAGEAPVAATVTWAAGDYGSDYLYQVSGPGFSGTETVARTGSRAVVVPGQVGSDANRVYTLHVLRKLPVAPWAPYPTTLLAGPYHYQVTGSNTGPGTVYGTDCYSGSSPVSGAALHAGLVAEGQTRNLTVSITDMADDNSGGSERNGIMSQDYDRNTEYGYTLSPGPDGTPFLTRTATVTALDRPTAPAGLNYAEKTATSVTLVWLPARYQAGVSGYNVYRDGTLAGTTAELVYTDTGRAPNTAYTYTLKAIGTSGALSLASPGLTVTTTQDFSADADHDGIPDATETALGTHGASAANADTTNQTQAKIHRPRS